MKKRKTPTAKIQLFPFVSLPTKIEVSRWASVQKGDDGLEMGGTVKASVETTDFWRGDKNHAIKDAEKYIRECSNGSATGITVVLSKNVNLVISIRNGGKHIASFLERVSK